MLVSLCCRSRGNGGFVGATMLNPSKMSSVEKGTAANKGRYHTLARRVALLLAVLVLVLAAELHGRSRSLAGVPAEDKESVILFAEALRTVREGYVDQGSTDPKRLTYAAVRGMLGSLGDEWHTYLMTPEETEEKPEVFSRWPVGTGLKLQDSGDEVIVNALLDGSPAKEAGVEPGDVLVAVEGDSVEGEDITEVFEKLEGPEGSTVKLTVLREGEEHGFSVERTKLEASAISWNLVPDTDVAHLRLARFSKNSASELEEAIVEAQKVGAKRFILDLRDNPGGWVRQAEGVATLFLPAGSPIYARKDAYGELEERTVPRNNDYLDTPLVVLVNERSGSSAEIVAGALKDNGRAKLVGERTSGVGTLIEDYPLRDGSTIFLSVAEWLTPNGDLNRGSGIAPNIESELVEGHEPRSPDEVRGLSREEIFAEDLQLDRAFKVLQEE